MIKLDTQERVGSKNLAQEERDLILGHPYFPNLICNIVDEHRRLVPDTKLNTLLFRFGKYTFTLDQESTREILTMLRDGLVATLITDADTIEHVHGDVFTYREPFMMGRVEANAFVAEKVRLLREALTIEEMMVDGLQFYPDRTNGNKMMSAKVVYGLTHFGTTVFINLEQVHAQDVWDLVQTKVMSLLASNQYSTPYGALQPLAEPPFVGGKVNYGALEKLRSGGVGARMLGGFPMAPNPFHQPVHRSFEGNLPRYLDPARALFKGRLEMPSAIMSNEARMHEVEAVLAKVVAETNRDYSRSCYFKVAHTDLMYDGFVVAIQPDTRKSDEVYALPVIVESMLGNDAFDARTSGIREFTAEETCRNGWRAHATYDEVWQEIAVSQLLALAPVAGRFKWREKAVVMPLNSWAPERDAICLHAEVSDIIRSTYDCLMPGDQRG